MTRVSSRRSPRARGGIQGLGSSVDAATTSDGAYVYTTSDEDGALAAYSRVAGTGQLTFIEALRDRVGGLSGLNFARSPVISPDDKFVYVASIGDNAVTVFERDPGTGELSFVQTLDESTVGSLSGPVTLEMSGDGSFLYVATQGTGASSIESIVVLARNPADGELSFVESQTTGGSDVVGLAIDSNDEYLYAVRSTGQDVSVFSIDETSGELDLESDFDPGGLSKRDIAISSDDKHLYLVERANAGVVHALSIDPSDGSLSFVESEVSGQNGVTGLSLPTKLTITPDGKYVIASATFDDSVVVFSRDDSTGELTFVDDNAGLTNGGSLSVTPDSAHVLVGGIGTGEDTLDVLSLATGTGALSSAQQLVESEGGVVGLNLPRTIAEAPDGNHIYAVSETDDALVALERDTGTGELSYVETERDGVDGASLSSVRDVVVSPDGEFVYVTAADDSIVKAYARDSSTGELTAIAGGAGGMFGAGVLAIAPDGASLYVARSSSSIRVYSRNGSTGSLSAIEDLTSGSGGVTGMTGISGIEVSPDGAHVYVTGGSSDSVAIFSRDPATSELTFVDSVVNNQNGVSGLDGAFDLASSPDGSFLFAVSTIDDSIVSFTRDAGTGALTFVGNLSDGVGGVDGLDGPLGVEVAPDGGHVYTASPNDDAISIFAIAPGTGALTFQGCLGDTNSPTCPDDGDTVEGLGGARSIAIVPGGAHAYVAAEDDDAVSAFALEGGGTGTDVTAPDTTITFGIAQGSTTFETTHTFGFLSSEPGSTFECRIDETGGFGDCDSPFTTSEQAVGPHTFEVRATDPAGNTDTIPARRDYTIALDTVPPETTITSGPAEGSTVGSGSQTFTFESDAPDADFECKVNDSPFLDCTSPRATGALKAGPNTFQVLAIKPGGTPDPTPAVRNFTVTAPNTFIDSGPAQGSTIGDSTPTFTFSSDTAVVQFECSADGGPFESCSSPFTTAELADGPHNFRVRAKDFAPNVDPTPAARDFIVSTGPDPACSDGADNDGDGKVDFPADPGCTGAGDNSEVDPDPGPGPGPDPDARAACNRATTAQKKVQSKSKTAKKRVVKLKKRVVKLKKRAKKASGKKKRKAQKQARKAQKQARKAQKQARKKMKQLKRAKDAKKEACAGL